MDEDLYLVVTLSVLVGGYCFFDSVMTHIFLVGSTLFLLGYDNVYSGRRLFFFF